MFPAINEAANPRIDGVREAQASTGSEPGCPVAPGGTAIGRVTLGKSVCLSGLQDPSAPINEGENSGSRPIELGGGLSSFSQESVQKNIGQSSLLGPCVMISRSFTVGIIFSPHKLPDIVKS